MAEHGYDITSHLAICTEVVFPLGISRSMVVRIEIEAARPGSLPMLGIIVHVD